MELFPAIDLYAGCAVRLLQGDYARRTVYSHDPCAVARAFAACGAKNLHVVDLEGARSGGAPHRELIAALVRETSLFVEVGGGIRSMETAEAYLELGAGRVILGTAAVKDRPFLLAALARFGERVAVGVDIRDGQVAVQGWTEGSGLDARAFCRDMEALGVRTLICTDISRDGAMRGTNRALYQQLQAELGLNIIASGGVSSLEDIRALRALGLHGAILGKAYYTGAVDLREALEAAQ